MFNDMFVELRGAYHICKLFLHCNVYFVCLLYGCVGIPWKVLVTLDLPPTARLQRCSDAVVGFASLEALRTLPPPNSHEGLEGFRKNVSELTTF